MSTVPIIDLTPMAFDILKALARYRYLTTNQIIAMGIAKDRGHLGTVLASLLSTKRRQRPGSTKLLSERLPKEIGEFDFGTSAATGRRPRIYWLAKRGASSLEHIEPELAPVAYPARPVRFAPHYEHHVGCVDFHIALTGWAEKEQQTIEYFRPCFDWLPTRGDKRPEPATRLHLAHKNIDADSLFLLRGSDDIRRAFVFEYARGAGTTRVLEKMQHIARGIVDYSLNKTLAFPQEDAVRTLFVFEHAQTAELVRSRAATFTPLRDVLPYFFLKTMADISADTLRHGWLSLDPQGEPRSLF